MTWLSNLFQAFGRPFKWWVVIAEWEQGLRVRLGKHSKKLQPGIHLRIPFLDRIFIQSIRMRTIGFVGTTAYTNDGKTITVSAAISFAISDVQKMYNTVSTPEQTISAIVTSTLIEEIYRTDVEHIDLEKLQNVVAEATTELTEWGMTDVSAVITGFTVCRAFRLLQGEWMNGGSLYDLDNKEFDGER